MSKEHQNDPDHFPHLNPNQLERQARRWVNEYPKVPIERIVLYPYAPKFQKYIGFIAIKYAVVFEVSSKAFDPLYLQRQIERDAQEYYSAGYLDKVVTPGNETFTRRLLCKILSLEKDYFFCVNGQW